jgi:hypothetical protein
MRILSLRYSSSCSSFIAADFHHHLFAGFNRRAGLLDFLTIAFRVECLFWVNPRRGRILRAGPLNPNLPALHTHPQAAAVRHKETFALIFVAQH